LRNRRALLTGVGVTAIFAVGAFAPVASAEQVTNQDIPFTGLAELNPCNAESVVLSGALHMRSTITLNSGGGAEVTNHFNFQDVQGAGDQGNSYRGQLTENSSSHVASGVTETSPVDFKMVSQGAAPNFEVRELLHITYNAKGEPTASVFSVSTSCIG
jgi:hypothetical protein